MTTTATPVPHRLLTAVLTLGIPFASIVAARLWVTSFAGDLPDPVAVHWGADGRPNDFASWQWSYTVIAAITVSLCVMAAAIGIGIGRASAVRRIAVFLGLWSGLALPWFVAGTLYLQRGLADAAEAPDVTLALLMAFLPAAVVAGVVTALTPGDPPLPTSDAVAADASRLPLADSESASWQQTVQMTGFFWVATIGGVSTVTLATLAWWLGIGWAPLWAGTIGVLTILLLALGRWKVTIDHTGLNARPFTMWPRIHIQLDEVVSADTTAVRPLGDFGGWGYRVGKGGTVGIVVRTGSAIRIERTGGRSLVITVDDAKTGAALLNTLADRARRR